MARSVNIGYRVLAFPFDLPTVSRGYAELSSAAREAGARAAAAAAAALGEQLGCAIRIAGRALTATTSEGLGWSRMNLELSALPGSATLEIESALVARVVDRLAGGSGELPGAVSLTPVEATALDLLALIALDGICGIPDIEEGLSPRLTRMGDEPTSALVVAIELELGGLRGRARLALPPAAVRVFRGEARLGERLASAVLVGSLRKGSASVGQDELASLSPGDVLVLDADTDPREQLRFPGGARLKGRADVDGFHVEEISMTETAGRFPITLEVELARVPMTFSELARLEPGAVLTLPCGHRGAVTLRAGERAVAQGELVEVEGALGVRIVRLGE